MIFAILLTAALIAVCTSVQYGALRGASALIRCKPRPDKALPVTVSAVAVAHASEALLYAVGFWFAVHGPGIGDLLQTGEGADLDFMSYFYFSLVNLTTLGRGDLTPTGHLRFMTAMEAFHGFLLITASGSFILQVMAGRNPFRT